jgi:hypothetical protein
MTDAGPDGGNNEVHTAPSACPALVTSAAVTVWSLATTSLLDPG